MSAYACLLATLLALPTQGREAAEAPPASTNDSAPAPQVPEDAPGATEVRPSARGDAAAHAEDLRRGRDAALREDWAVALPSLHTYFAAAAPGDEDRAWAQLHLARGLEAAKLWHAAAALYADLLNERTNPAVLPEALGRLQALFARPHDDLLLEEATLANLEVAALPPAQSGFVAYQQGLRELKRGRGRWAKGFFAKIPAGTAESIRAEYALAVAKLRASREATPSLLGELEQLAEAPAAPRPLRNEVLLALARLHYEEERYERAISTYRKVQLPPLSAGRASLYLEEAWSRYRLGQPREALALLVVLDAPAFRRAFLPDKYLLKAFVYRDLCQYLLAKKAAKALRRDFADALEAITEREALSSNARLLDAATADGVAFDAKVFRDALRVERRLLEERASTLGGALTLRLRALYEQALGEAERRYLLAAEAAVEEKANLLLEASEQARLMDYEVGLKLHARLRRDATVLAAAPTAAGTHGVRFKFRGEYWNDELRDYHLTVQNRCTPETSR